MNIDLSKKETMPSLFVTSFPLKSAALRHYCFEIEKELNQAKRQGRPLSKSSLVQNAKKKYRLSEHHLIYTSLTGPLGAISTSAIGAPPHPHHATNSEANSAATSRTGSKENLCEECIQHPLDLIDASIQVRLCPPVLHRHWPPLEIIFHLFCCF